MIRPCRALVEHEARALRPLLAGAEAGHLRHRPELGAIAVRLGAARVRVLAREADVAQVVEADAPRDRRRVERLDRPVQRLRAERGAGARRARRCPQPGSMHANVLRLERGRRQRTCPARAADRSAVRCVPSAGTYVSRLPRFAAIGDQTNDSRQKGANIIPIPRNSCPWTTNNDGSVRLRNDCRGIPLKRLFLHRK